MSCAGAGAIHTPALSRVALTGPSGDNAAATLLHGRSAATTDAHGLAWVVSEWCAQASLPLILMPLTLTRSRASPPC